MTHHDHPTDFNPTATAEAVVLTVASVRRSWDAYRRDDGAVVLVDASRTKSVLSPDAARALGEALIAASGKAPCG